MQSRNLNLKDSLRVFIALIVLTTFVASLIVLLFPKMASTLIPPLVQKRQALGSYSLEKGEVLRLSSGDSIFLPIANNSQIIFEHDLIMTGTDGKLNFHVDNFGDLKIGPNSLIKIYINPTSLAIKLYSGGAEALNIVGNISISTPTGQTYVVNETSADVEVRASQSSLKIKKSNKKKKKNNSKTKSKNATDGSLKGSSSEGNSSGFLRKAKLEKILEDFDIEIEFPQPRVGMIFLYKKISSIDIFPSSSCQYQCSLNVRFGKNSIQRQFQQGETPSARLRLTNKIDRGRYDWILHDGVNTTKGHFFIEKFSVSEIKSLIESGQDFSIVND